MKFAGVGIDILSRKRAAKLIQNHSQKQLRTLLAPAERKKKITPLYLAKILCAKEAYFKAIEGSAMVWSDLEVKVLPRQSFEVQSTRSKARQGVKKAQGSFFQSSAYVGAQVILWDA